MAMRRCKHRYRSERFGDRAQHTSGTGSQADITVTRTLREAAKILDIELLDHVIVGDAKADPQGRGYFSFKEAGHL